MNRCLAIGLKGHTQEVLGCGLTESEAMEFASTARGYDSIEVYINPTPFSVFNCKPSKAKPSKKKAK